MHLDEVENPFLELVKHADLHVMEEVRLREFAHNTANMSKHFDLSVDIAR